MAAVALVQEVKAAGRELTEADLDGICGEGVGGRYWSW
jgi:hypothetical protein